MYAAAPCLVKDAEHQADPDPLLYLLPAGSPGHGPEAVPQAAVGGTARVPIKWGEFWIRIQLSSLAITHNCHCRHRKEVYKRWRLSRLWIWSLGLYIPLVRPCVSNCVAWRAREQVMALLFSVLFICSHVTVPQKPSLQELCPRCRSEGRLSNRSLTRWPGCLCIVGGGRWDSPSSSRGKTSYSGSAAPASLEMTLVLMRSGLWHDLSFQMDGF